MATQKEQQPEQRKKRFVEMTTPEKLGFLGKVVLFLVTGGFAYPTIFSPD